VLTWYNGAVAAERFVMASCWRDRSPASRYHWPSQIMRDDERMGYTPIGSLGHVKLSGRLETSIRRPVTW
jgi:hypothetical protein